MKEPFNLINRITVNKDKGIIIWLCNIGAEKYWNKLSMGISDRNEDVIVNHVEEMNLLLCREQDVIILREKPDPKYLDMLKKLGFGIPRVLTPVNPDPLTPISELVLKDEYLLQELKSISENNSEVYFIPYAVTKIEEQIAEICDLKLTVSSSTINAKINDKIFNREIAEKLKLPVCEGKICYSFDEIRSEYNRLINSEYKFEKVIIKEPFGASGKGLYIIDSSSKLETTLRIIARFSSRDQDAKWLVEGWYDKKADINYQIYISPTGDVSMFSIKQQLLNDTIYIGSKIPADLSEQEFEKYNGYAELIGKQLYKLGYMGVAGIDSIITRDGTIIPIIEINGRFTLSTYISFINSICNDRKVFTQYFRVVTKSPTGFEQLNEILEKNQICFNLNKKEGVIVYTSATLPTRLNKEGTGYLGRIFTLIVAEDENRIEFFRDKLQSLVEAL